MHGKSALVFIIIALIAGGGWYLLQKDVPTPALAPTPSAPVVTETPAPETPPAATPPGVTITYTAQGFSPKDVSIPLGTTVTFVNQTDNRMWVGADVHPTHQSYDGSTMSAHCAPGYSGPAPFDQCATGQSYSFTFLKTGTWVYHNHASAGDKGTVTVTEEVTPI